MSEDAEYEFVRFDRLSVSRTDVLVRVITWSSPHVAVSSWETWRTLDHQPGPAERDSLFSQVLADPKYFGACVGCGEVAPRGWMHSTKVCQGCAQKNHAVVY